MRVMAGLSSVLDAIGARSASAVGEGVDMTTVTRFLNTEMAS
jgi:hypothetical protein